MNAKLVRVGVAIGILFAGTSTSNDGHAAESPTTETPPKSGEPEVPVKEGTPEEAPSVGWVALPNIYYAPETGAGLGGFGLFFWHAGPTEKVRPSQVVASFSYTTKQQTIIDASVPLWLFENALTITPTFGYINYPIPFFGIGNDNDPTDGETYTERTVTGSLDFGVRVFPHTYVGGHLIGEHAEIVDVEPGGRLASGTVPGSQGGSLVGVGPTLAYDDRDNLYAPSRGTFASLSAGFRLRALGSDFAYTQIVADLRHYLPLGPGTLAMQLRASFADGDVPFFRMNTIGGATDLRGIFAGFYRDNNAFQTQLDYRFPIYGRWGGAAFVGMGEVMKTLGDISLRGLHPAAGAGVRFMLIKSERVAIRLDLAEAAQGMTYYLQVGEGF